MCGNMDAEFRFSKLQVLWRPGNSPEIKFSQIVNHLEENVFKEVGHEVMW